MENTASFIKLYLFSSVLSLYDYGCCVSIGCFWLFLLGVLGTLKIWVGVANSGISNYNTVYITLQLKFTIAALTTNKVQRCVTTHRALHHDSMVITSDGQLTK